MLPHLSVIHELVAGASGAGFAFGCPGKKGAEQAGEVSAPSSIVLLCEWTAVLWLLLKPLAKSLCLPDTQFFFLSHHLLGCSLTFATPSSPWTAAKLPSVKASHSVHAVCQT